MIFAEVPLARAEGTILAHSLRVGQRRFRKGLLLTAEDLAELAEAGIDALTVARLEPGDLDEDAAARRVAEALVTGPGLRLTRATTGRVNVMAKGPGVARLDAARIDAVNLVDPMITVATVPQWQRQAPRDMVATVKIIAYGVAEAAVERAAAAGAGAIALAAPCLASAALIETEVPGGATGKGKAAIEGRLAALGCRLTGHVTVPHRVAPLAAALERAGDAELLLILTGSATSDPADVAPAAVRQAGGEVEHFGMPVDPGNLLFVGWIGARPVIGLPGCVRSPALNGADWVLERLICGVPVTARDIMSMGVGGLLKESPARPHPRAGKGPG